MAALTDKQKMFCDQYLIDFNATQSAIRAGYSKKTAGQIGEQNLKKLEIQNYLQSKKQKLANKLEITQERTLREIGRIAFSDTRMFFDEEGRLKNISDLDDDAASVLAGMDITEEFEYVDRQKIQTGVTKKIKLWDKTKGLEMLAKHFKIYSDAPVVNNNLKFGYGPEQPV